MSAPEQPFEEPWQAQLFALTVAMNEAGHFSWTDWSATFGPMVQAAPASVYWDIWSDALVALLNARGIATSADIQDLTSQWQEAARSTPHGTPIVLEKSDHADAPKAVPG